MNSLRRRAIPSSASRQPVDGDIDERRRMLESKERTLLHMPRPHELSPFRLRPPLLHAPPMLVQQPIQHAPMRGVDVLRRCPGSEERVRLREEALAPVGKERGRGARREERDKRGMPVDTSAHQIKHQRAHGGE
jgi:hypothetical protein